MAAESSLYAGYGTVWLCMAHTSLAIKMMYGSGLAGRGN